MLSAAAHCSEGVPTGLSSLARRGCGHLPKLEAQCRLGTAAGSGLRQANSPSSFFSLESFLVQYSTASIAFSSGSLLCASSSAPGGWPLASPISSSSANSPPCCCSSAVSFRFIPPASAVTPVVSGWWSGSSGAPASTLRKDQPRSAPSLLHTLPLAPSAAGVCEADQQGRARQRPAHQGQSLLCELKRGLHPGNIGRLSLVHKTCPAGTYRRHVERRRPR